jgi:hypothetical protein
MKREIPLILVLSIAAFALGCGRGSAKGPDPASGTPVSASAADGESLTGASEALSQQTDKGIGPVKELNFGPIDSKLAGQGKNSSKRSARRATP